MWLYSQIVLFISIYRQYEEKELQAQQERGKKRLEYENQKYRIQTQLEYEKSRDTYANVEKYRTQIEEEEQELERMRKAEKTQMEVNLSLKTFHVAFRELAGFTNSPCFYNSIEQI